MARDNFFPFNFLAMKFILYNIIISIINDKLKSIKTFNYQFIELEIIKVTKTIKNNSIQ